jgi:hypothetical protein
MWLLLLICENIVWNVLLIRGEDILNKMWSLSISANMQTLLRGNVVIIDRYINV